MGGDENTIHLVTAAGVEDWPRLPKSEVAERLVARIGGFSIRGAPPPSRGAGASHDREGSRQRGGAADDALAIVGARDHASRRRFFRFDQAMVKPLPGATPPQSRAER